MKKSLSAFLIAVTSLNTMAAIFGVDDRISIRPGSLGYEVSRSTAVALLSSNVENNGPGRLKLNTDKMSDWICPTSRFANQPILSYSCSGFLVAPNLIVTAGHCMVNTGESRNETQTYCKAYSWLFDYNETTNINSVPASNHYKCKKVIYAVKDERAPFRDYALVELDRPVVGRAPLKINPAPVKNNELFSMIGHPFGLPAKLSKNARVLVNTTSRQSFLTSLDAFEGNSGSAVFNSKNEVIGILVGGTPSMNTVTNGRCDVLNRCAENGTNCLLPDKNPAQTFPGYQGVGSEVQRIAPVLKLIQEHQAPKRR